MTGARKGIPDLNPLDVSIRYSQPMEVHKFMNKKNNEKYAGVSSKERYAKTKRTVDVILSGAALACLSPLLLGIGVAIKMDSKGPVIFRQKRIGIHKSQFEIYKFRTMYADTPKDMPTHLLQNSDSMVTKTGAFLRKYSLDELPQLFNILRGDMSIVGPRPALWNQYDLIAERDKYGANDVLPGLTGWAQINGRDELEIPVKAKLDGEYVRKYGLWMDIRCIIGTVFAVARHKGVVEGGTGTINRQDNQKNEAPVQEQQQNCKPAGKRGANKGRDKVRLIGKLLGKSKKEEAGGKERQDKRCLLGKICRKERQDKSCPLGKIFGKLGKKKAGGDNQAEQSPLCGKDLARQIYMQQQGTLSAKKKILITGEGSYIGTAFRDWLSGFGGHYEATELNMHGDAWKQHDFSQYDAVFHVAGIAHADIGRVSNAQKQSYYEVNRDLAAAAAKKAKEAGVKQFIYMSSMIIYGDSAPIGERKRITAMTRPQPSNFYGNSKWQGERAVWALAEPGFQVCIVRAPMVYGRGSKGNYPQLAKLAGRLPVFPLIQNERSVLHIDHLCEFVRLLVEHNEAGIFFPQNSAYADTSGMAAMIAEAQGKKLVLTRTLRPFVMLAARLPRIGKKVNKAFGNFSYDLSMSEYHKGNYRLHDLKESIYVTQAPQDGGR